MSAIRDERGRFVPGNPLWSQHAFDSHRAAVVGRQPMYTPHELQAAIDEWIEKRTQDEKPLTVYGLARHLGVHVDTLHSWRNGEIGKDEETKRAYSEAMIQAWYALYDQGETAALTGKGGRNAWLWLANVDRKGHDGEGWRAEQHVISQQTTEHRFTLSLGGDSPEAQELAKRLGRGVTIDHDDN